MDVASTLEVNDIKSACYVTISCDCDLLSWYMLFVTWMLYISSKCLHVLVQLKHYRRLKASLNVTSVCLWVYQCLFHSVISHSVKVFPVYLFGQISIVEVECVELWKFKTECWLSCRKLTSHSTQWDSLWTVRVVVGHTIEDIALTLGNIAPTEELRCGIS